MDLLLCYDVFFEFSLFVLFPVDSMYCSTQHQCCNVCDMKERKGVSYRALGDREVNPAEEVRVLTQFPSFPLSNYLNVLGLQCFFLHYAHK